VVELAEGTLRGVALSVNNLVEGWNALLGEYWQDDDAYPPILQEHSWVVMIPMSAE
jgi:hypothetical protein